MHKLYRAFNLTRVLSKAQLRSSDYNSILGILWSLMGPLLNFSVMYFIFVERLGKNIPNFALKLFIGIICLSFFQLVVNTVMNSVSDARYIVQNSLTPAESFIIAQLTVPVLKFCVEISLCLGLTLLLKPLPIYLFLELALCGTLLFLLAIGIGLLIGTLACFVGDIKEIWVYLSPLLNFLSPVFYSLDMLSETARNAVYWLNPLAPFIMSFQSLITGSSVPLFTSRTLYLAAGLSLFYFLAGYLYYKKMEKQLVERL